MKPRTTLRLRPKIASFTHLKDGEVAFDRRDDPGTAYLHHDLSAAQETGRVYLAD